MDDSKYSSRLKSINLTKSQESYRRYLKVVPKESRIKQLSSTWHPSTPDYRVNLSHSQWTRKLSHWRRLIHKWDCVTDFDIESLSNCLKKLDYKTFVSICEKNRKKETQIELDVSDHLLNNHTSDLYYPVIYKPQWFNGSINHNGFQTINEIDFLKNSKQFLSNLDEDFTSRFMSSYTNNYNNLNSN